MYIILNITNNETVAQTIIVLLWCYKRKGSKLFLHAKCTTENQNVSYNTISNHKNLWLLRKIRSRMNELHERIS